MILNCCHIRWMIASATPRGWRTLNGLSVLCERTITRNVCNLRLRNYYLILNHINECNRSWGKRKIKFCSRLKLDMCGTYGTYDQRATGLRQLVSFLQFIHSIFRENNFQVTLQWFSVFNFIISCFVPNFLIILGSVMKLIEQTVGLSYVL